ncbi:hypothetical protein HYV49_02435 [Candidatus Pacearchaeota archaeon]|nr:hypothetical protein [Candidatus Pacearchaeota archaeon]
MKDKKKIKITDNKEIRIFLKPGRNNKEERLNFVRYWAQYVKNHKDEDWSGQQNLLIDSQVQ